MKTVIPTIPEELVNKGQLTDYCKNVDITTPYFEQEISLVDTLATEEKPLIFDNKIMDKASKYGVIIVGQKI